MGAATFKRLLVWGLSIVLCAASVTGCSKGTPDEYYWSSYYDTMEVPLESSDPSESSGDSDNFDNSAADDSSDTNSSDNTQPSAPEQTTPHKNYGLTNVKVDPDDKPTVKNTANLMNPITALSDSAADTLRNEIINTTDNIKVTGKIYYISYRGNDFNDGLSPENPWQSLTKLSYSGAQLRSGDAVLFERGGVYRGTVKCVNGVTYGAYGTGDKPCIYQSKANAAKKAWNKDSENIWIAPYTYPTDVGIIIFNHGEMAGDKKFTKAELTKNGDFFYSAGIVYMYMDKEPSTKFKSIEIGSNSHIFSIPQDSHDITIDNITIKYGGAMGVQVSTGAKNITVKNCEIGWLGGSVLSGYGDGQTRYGNGVEFWNACENVKVDNCWVYQIYDSGLSHQGNGVFVAKDVTFSNNLVEYTSFGSIEYWADSQRNNKMVNITYSDNILRFAGYGWGEIGRPAHQACLIIATGTMDQYCENFVIKNNILDTALKDLVNIRHISGKLPDLEGNTYYQSNGDKNLGKYGDSASAPQYYIDDANIVDVLKTVFGDSHPTVQYK